MLCKTSAEPSYRINYRGTRSEPAHDTNDVDPTVAGIPYRCPTAHLLMGITRSTDVEMSIDGLMQMATISAIGVFAFPTRRRWSPPTQLRWPITFPTDIGHCLFEGLRTRH